MPIPLSFRARNLLVAGLFVSVLGARSLSWGAYDAPNFDRPLAEVDALSLKKRDREELVSALTAITRNFPDEAAIDDDLREKAIALALTLDPVSADARQAHERLMAGRRPPAVSYFTSLGAISEALWRHAETLSARDAEPEDHRLAPMLMEISLLIAPGKISPPRRLAFQRATEEAPVNWNRYVTLQPKVNPSNARTIALFRPVDASSNGNEKSPQSPAVAESTATTTTTPTGSNGAMAAGAEDGAETATSNTDSANLAVSEIRIPESALSYVAIDRGGQVRAIGGVASFKVREPTQDEQSLFGLFIETGTKQSFEMRLTYDRDGPEISGTDRAETLIRRKFPRWPDRRLGEFTFRPPAGQTAPESVRLDLPALLMLSAAFSGTALNEAFSPAREFALAGELGSGNLPRIPDQVTLTDLVRAANAMPVAPKALFVPSAEEKVGTSLTDAALAGEPQLLMRPQLIGYDSLETLQKVVFGETPAELTAAIEDFVAVQNLTNSMEVDVIARNAVVQNRLRAIVEKWPGHLSAQLLLAYGSRPADSGMTLRASRDAIFKAIHPVDQYYQQQINGTGGGLVGKVDTLVDEAKRTLSGLRTEIDPAVKDYLAAAEDSLDAYQVYLSLNNRSSSLGQQRLRELQEQLNVLRLKHLELGLGSEPPRIDEN
ncbi:MAG: hypothetical protein KDN19_03865 [Verrucomicrobiae bacterium]|nr:hypothetical protein [Verrucomicrobiae bacterium]